MDTRVAETWREIPGYETRYAISASGCVRSLRREIPVNQRINAYGYPVVTLDRGRQGGRTTIAVHILVMLAFVGPRPIDQPIIRHLNGIKTDSRLENLTYGTYSENELDKRRLGELPDLPTHCHKGHPFDEANTYVRPGNVGRSCRACRREAQSRYVARRAAVA